MVDSNGNNNSFEGLPLRKRLALARHNIEAAASAGGLLSIEAEVRKAGFQGEPEFWEATLGITMTAEEFAELLIFLHSLSPTVDEKPADSAIKKELDICLRQNPPFVIRDDGMPRHFQYHIETALVQPRAAAIWLIGSPSCRRLVPEQIRAFIEGGIARSASTVEIEPKLPSLPKHPGGAPHKFEWSLVQQLLKEHCEYQGDVPRRGALDLKWQSRADACRYVREQMRRDWGKDDGPSGSTLKLRVKSILEEIEAEIAKKNKAASGFGEN